MAEAVEKAVKVDAAVVPNRRALKPGEWACVDAKCAHVNAEKRNSCEVCGKAKPKAKSKAGREIGKDAAEKSKGLFSADDWVCTKCGNVNWARRNVCNVCNAPKLADLEVRTGYGGGYMDRQNVEYIERDDDEEFDEFGRKKKRRKLDDNEQNPVRMEDQPKQSEDFEFSKRDSNNKEGMSNEDEEEEDDDSDSDDGDLDKYDLTADPELIALTEKLKPTTEKLSAANGDDEQRPPSTMSSDCTCSCSGGECSCVESEEEDLLKKKPRSDRDERHRRRSADREHDRPSNAGRSGSSRDKDRRDDRDQRDARREDPAERKGKDRDRERSRSKEMDRRRGSRERDHHRR